MVPRFRLISRNWRAAPLLLFSMSLASPSAPVLARPTRADDVTGPATVDQRRPDRTQAAASYQLPLSFEVNRGQADPSVEFVAHGLGYSLALTAGGAVLSLHQRSSLPATAPPGSAAADQLTTVLSMELQGANPHPESIGEEPLQGTTNYFIGSDPTQWHTGVPTYARVRYLDVYPGVDLIYYGTAQGQLEDDFVVSPGADAGAVKLTFAGADGLDLEDTGALLVHTAGAEVRLQAPNVFQDADGLRQPVSAAYVIGQGQDVEFQVADYDTTRPLVIDPVLAYSTFLGGSSFELGSGIAVDAAGNAYVTGTTGSTDFPTSSGAFQTTLRDGDDAFVSKLNPTGTALVYSTFIGGGSSDGAFSIAVDAHGNVYVRGFTNSSDFPTTPGAFQKSLQGAPDAFITKVDPTGTALVYSTYLGGSGGELSPSSGGNLLAVDAAGSAYVTGITASADFPTTPGAFQRALGAGTPDAGTTDAFVTKLNPSGTALVYSTYLGGSSVEEAFGIAVDRADNAYVTGITGSSDFPTTPGAFQKSLQGAPDAFITKLNPSGTALVYSTFLGGSSLEKGSGIAVDAAGNAYVTGETGSTDFPTSSGAFQTTRRGAVDAFVSKLNPSGTALVYSTYLGGSDGDNGMAIAVDTAGNAYVTGATGSSDFPRTPGAFHTPLSGGSHGFVNKLNPNGTALVYSTELGGSNSFDTGMGIAVDAAGNAYVTGETESSDFPTTAGAFQTALRGGLDAFVLKISSGPPACEVTGLLSGPPPQLQIAVHADRGLSSVLTTRATNATVAIPSFGTGATDTQATATNIDQATTSSFTLHVADLTGASTDCDSGAFNTGTTVTTPRVVTLLPNSNSRGLDVQLRIDCSPPMSDLSGPVGGTAQTTTTVTQDQGAIVGQRSVALPCGRSGFALEANADSRPFHLGDAEITVQWSVQWLRSGCTSDGCVVTEQGTANGATIIIASGTQPPNVPAPF